MIRFFRDIVYFKADEYIQAITDLTIVRSKLKFYFCLGLILYLLVSSQTLFAQSKISILELEQKLTESISDTSRVHILNELAYKLTYIHPDSAFLYASEAEGLAKKINFEKGLAKTDRLLGDFSMDRGALDAALKHYERALELANKYELKYEAAQVLNNIALWHDMQGDSVNTIKYFEESLKLKEALEDERGVIISYINLGDFHRRRGNTTKALAYFNQCIGRAEIIKDTFLLVQAYNAIGVIHQDDYNNQNAIDNFQQGLELAETVNNTHFIATISNNLGELYFKLKQYDIALRFFEKELEWFEKSNYKLGIAIASVNIGTAYLFKEDYDNALKYYKLSLPNIGEIENNKIKIALYSGLGNVYEKRDSNYSKALFYYEKWLDIAEEQGAVREQTDAYLHIGRSHLGLKEYDEALKWCKKAGNQSVDYIDLNQKSCKCLSESFEGLGMYKEALSCHRHYKKLTDTIYQIDYSKNILALTAQQKTELEWSELEKKQEVEEERTRTRNAFLIGLITALALLIITFIMRANSKRIAQKNRELAHSNRIKEQFIASISHQVRTPMNSIMGFTDMLLDSVPTQFKSPLQDIKFAGSHLMKLLTATLDLSQLAQEKIVLEQKEFDLQASLNRLLEVQEATNSNTKIDLNLKFVGKSLKHKLVGDEERLHQILSCLLENAIKFTEEGEVLLNITTSIQDEDKAHINFEVKDTGIGIAGDRLPFIFDSFSELADVKEQQFAGSGLGLSIAKRLTELYDSALHVTSELGEGSNFYFQLEFPLGTELSMESFIEHQLASMRVLLVEDNLLNQKLAQKALEMKGMEVTTAGNGALGLAALQSNDFDVILMDLNMPVMDGFEATRRIRLLNNPKANTPIIVLTALDDHAKAEIEPFNISGYMRKPFKSQDLYASIYQVVNKEKDLVFS